MTASRTGDAARFREASQLLAEGADAGAYSAAVLLVGCGDEVIWEESAGYAHAASLFDVASVTKPLIAALVFVLAQEGHLRVDGPVAEILPMASPDARAREIRLFHLLSHTAGLPACLPLYERVLEAERALGRPLFGTAEGHDRLLAEIVSLPLSYAPGSSWEYSDLGYILLGRGAELAGFHSLNRLLKEKVADPLGMRETCYLPLSVLSECETGRIIPTGWSEVRGREKAGEVDDDNAAAMGGVAGHAGLFTTARELFLFAREVLRARRGEGRLLGRPAAERMTARVAHPPGCPRTLGFDTPTGGPDAVSQAGRLVPERVVGHLGYTGCSLWIDLDREVTAVLLTNRVVFGPDNRRLSELRPRIHDAVWKGTRS
jgi:CubicO group peptidase (beta-lactamase class C family)